MAIALSPRFNDAFVWAASLHRNQVRKSSDTPYIGHLLGVAGLVIESGGSEDQAIAALLHDVIEDQGVSVAEISSRFGQKVANLVDAVTESYTKPKPDWEQCKRLYLDKLPNSSPEVVLISLADKLHNARALEEGLHAHGEGLWKKFFKSRKQETFWFYKELMEVYRTKGFDNSWLLLELQRSVKRIFQQ